jgi:hypothetical protein
MNEGWDLHKRMLVGLGAIAVLEVLEWAVGLRRRASRAIALRLYDYDHSTRVGLHRGEVSMFIAGLTGARRHR